MKTNALHPAALPAVTTILLWSSAFAGIRMGLETFGPGELTLLRFLTASIAMLPLALASGMPKPDRADMIRIIILGLSGVTLYHLALNIGEMTVNSGTASFIIATSPVFTTLLSSAMLKERISAKTAGGMSLSICGVLLMALGSNGGLVISAGTLYILAAAMLVAVFFTLQKTMLERYTAIQITAYSTWAGTIPLLLWAPKLVGVLPSAGLTPILAVVYIGIFPGALAYCTWAQTLKHLKPSTASTILYVNPCLAVGWGFLLRGEVPTLGQLAGGLVALSGVIIVNLAKGQGTRKVHAEPTLRTG